MEIKPNFYAYPGLKTHAQVQIRRKGNWSNEQLTAEEILTIVSDIFNISKEDIKSNTRLHVVHRARVAAQALMRHFTTLTFEEITKAVSRKNHASAIYSVNQSKNWIDSYEEYKEYYNNAFQYCKQMKQKYDEQASKNV